MEQTIAEGGYSYITYALYSFIPLFSIHNEINNTLSS